MERGVPGGSLVETHDLGQPPFDGDGLGGAARYLVVLAATQQCVTQGTAIPPG
jgi:hypothetical protein